MEWQVILALVLGIPIALFPVAFVWYLNLGGIYAIIREREAKRAAETKAKAAVTGKAA